MSNSQNKIIIITAPSGAGKTSITRHLLKTFPQLAFSVSAAPPMPGSRIMGGKSRQLCLPRNRRTGSALLRLRLQSPAAKSPSSKLHFTGVFGGACDDGSQRIAGHAPDRRQFQQDACRVHQRLSGIDPGQGRCPALFRR